MLCDVVEDTVVEHGGEVHLVVVSSLFFSLCFKRWITCGCILIYYQLEMRFSSMYEKQMRHFDVYMFSDGILKNLNLQIGSYG